MSGQATSGTPQEGTPQEAASSGSHPAESEEVQISVRGQLGHILLNRPTAINALNQGMVERISEALQQWLADDAVVQVAITGAGDRGFCAGGDIVALYDDARSGGGAAERFWREEYRLNQVIATYPKPIVTIMDGIVLGGGIGLGAHASDRVVTDRSKLGMPETTIGFVPDVGGTWLLSHAPGELGVHLALTAGSVGPGDAIALGLADYYLPSERIEAVLSELQTRPASQVLSDQSQDAPPGELATQQAWIDACYGGDDLAAIVARLGASNLPAAREAAETIGTKSPTSCAIALAMLRRSGAAEHLGQALDVEFRGAMHMHGHHDFVEGIRAQVVEKDRNPSWDPASIDDLPADVAERALAGLEIADLGLGGRQTSAESNRTEQS